MGLFRGAAAYYARFRPQYPAELIERLAAAAGLDERSRVLDLGSGPGHVAIPLSRHAAEVVAVDPEPEMLARIDAPHVRTVLGRAEDVDCSWGRFDLVSAGRSFHWFDQRLLLERLPLVTSQLALLGDSILQGEWQSLALELAAEVLGEDPPARRKDWYADVLAASPFDDVTELSVAVDRTWTADSLIGLVYSTSTAPRLAGRRGEFERRLRGRVGDGELRERVTVSAVLGRRRDE